ncbi:MAG TPA: sigma-70 family RNA polymerase sigma factor, partial [Opitutus sp.]|nr:sigma-70 family RNA polymerase sigma factor [Opitutus sp.]
MSLTADSERTPLSIVDDRVAIDEVLRGNREMFEVLVRRYNPRLFRVGMACLKRREQAEDAMQNAYLKAYLNLRHFRGESAFATWLTRIMINECRMALRKDRSNREDGWAEGEDEKIPDGNARPVGDGLSLNEMKHLLESAIGELPRKYRTVYMLREVQQLSTAEAAACLGITAENVKVTLHRAKEMLKNRLLKSAS